MDGTNNVRSYLTGCHFAAAHKLIVRHIVQNCGIRPTNNDRRVSETAGHIRKWDAAVEGFTVGSLVHHVRNCELRTSGASWLTDFRRSQLPVENASN